ncbi:MAG: hypothetical protein ACO1O6_12485 [Bacteroidota bacterium]
MKKLSLSLALLAASTQLLFAYSPGENNEDKKKKDSLEIAREPGFKTNLSDKLLSVEISGNIDSLASVSITNQRGSSILFSVVELTDQEIVFDLSQLEKGIYNVMYITNQEIRIKKVEVK